MCQAYSYGGTTGLVEADSIVGDMKAVKTRPLKIRFNADTASSMQWNFKPQQRDITVSFFIILISPSYGYAIAAKRYDKVETYTQSIGEHPVLEPMIVFHYTKHLPLYLMVPSTGPTYAQYSKGGPALSETKNSKACDIQNRASG